MGKKACSRFPPVMFKVDKVINLIGSMQFKNCSLTADDNANDNINDNDGDGNDEDDGPRDYSTQFRSVLQRDVIFFPFMHLLIFIKRQLPN